MTDLWWITALLAGLAGSLHCVAMCGPLAMALPVGRLTYYRRAAAVAVYHGGRLAAYAMLGVLSGLAGQSMTLVGLQSPLAVGSGLLLLIWTLGNRTSLYRLRSARSIRWITSPMKRLLQHPTPAGFAGLGFLNGLLPCGVVYVALAGALGTAGPVEGAGYMALFGLGTLPALIGVRWLADHLSLSVRRRLNPVLPLATVALSLLLIGRGIMPYILANTASRNAAPVAAPLCHGAVGK